MAWAVLLLGAAGTGPVPAVTGSLTNAAPAIAASVTTTTVGATANLPARLYTWQDEAGDTRSALMLDQTADRAGVLRQISYRVAGTNRVCSAVPSNGDDVQGMGYVENHLGGVGLLDYWTAGVSTSIGGTTTLVFTGRHHVIIQYTISNYTLNGNAIPTCVQWMFATGRSHPLFCVSQDARAYTAGNIGSDSRSPYGTLNIAGDGRNLPSQDYLISGISWGDTYKFVSVEPNTTNESITLLASSGWRYQEPNTIPYTMAWMTGANAEQGTVATTAIANQDQGSDPRTDPATGFQKNTQSLSGPMIGGDDWAYQMMNYPDLPTNGTTDTKMAWGMNFGALGGFDNWWPEGDLNLTEYSRHRDSSTPWSGSRTSGLFLSYSTFIVLGEHTGGYLGGATGKMVAQMENHQSATLAAQIGQLITQGPASRSISNSPVMAYSPAGYDPVYATWNAVAATNSAVSLTLTPAPGKPLRNPLFHISNYQSTNPPAVRIDGEPVYPDADYFASVDAVNHEVWLTLNRSVSSPCNITLDGELSAPQNVIASDGTYVDKVALTWSAASGAASYQVWRHTSNDSGSASQLTSGITGTNYDDTSATAGITYYYWVKAVNVLGSSGFSIGDSGWRANSIADFAMVDHNGAWTLWLSSGGYQPSGPYVMSVLGGVPVAADFDGDRLADPAMAANGDWTFWLSSGGYQPSGPYVMSVPGGEPVAADFDGDGLADPAMVANGGWMLWLSFGGYQPSGPYIFSVPGGIPMAGDFDGDGLADPAMVANGAWTIWLSSGGYQPSGPYEMSVPGGIPMAGDFDGDGLADPAMVANGAWTVWMSSGGYLPSGPYIFSVPGGKPVAADFDGE